MVGEKKAWAAGHERPGDWGDHEQDLDSGVLSCVIVSEAKVSAELSVMVSLR